MWKTPKCIYAQCTSLDKSLKTTLESQGQTTFLLLIEITASLELPKITENKNLKATILYIRYMNNPST